MFHDESQILLDQLGTQNPKNTQLWAVIYKNKQQYCEVEVLVPAGGQDFRRVWGVEERNILCQTGRVITASKLTRKNYFKVLRNNLL